MAFPTGTQSTTTLDVYLAEIWSTSHVNEFYRAKLKAAKHFLDMSGDLIEGGDTLHISGLIEKDASDKTTANAVTLDSDTELKVDLAVDTWKECSGAIEDKQAVQVLRSYNLQERLVRASAYAPAKSLDTALLSLYSGLSQNVNDSASAVADADILEAIQTLEVADVPAEDRAFFFYPSIVWGDLMAITKYYDASQSGFVGGLIPKGAMGMLYGIPVWSLTQVVISHTDFVHNLLAQKEAFVFATQMPGGGEGVRRQVNYIPQYLSTLYTCDLIYGVIENRDECAVEIQAIT